MAFREKNAPDEAETAANNGYIFARAPTKDGTVFAGRPVSFPLRVRISLDGRGILFHVCLRPEKLFLRAFFKVSGIIRTRQNGDLSALLGLSSLTCGKQACFLRSWNSSSRGKNAGNTSVLPSILTKDGRIPARENRGSDYPAYLIQGGMYHEKPETVHPLSDRLRHVYRRGLYCGAAQQGHPQCGGLSEL